MPNHRTTGLSPAQFATLLTTLEKTLIWDTSKHHPLIPPDHGFENCPTASEHNQTEEILAGRFKVSQPTISWAITSYHQAFSLLAARPPR